MRPQQEPHCYYFHAHLYRVNNKEYVVSVVLIVPRNVLGVIQSQEYGVYNNSQENYSVKPSTENIRVNKCYSIANKYNNYGLRTILITLSLKGLVTVRQQRETVA
jgi:hypothetical protein